MQRLGLHVHEACRKDTLRQQMAWDNVTSQAELTRENFPCMALQDCPCNVERNCGEVLEVASNAVQDCLKDFGPEGDRQLFEELAGAALTAEEGSVWKAG